LASAFFGFLWEDVATLVDVILYDTHFEVLLSLWVAGEIGDAFEGVYVDLLGMQMMSFADVGEEIIDCRELRENL